LLQSDANLLFPGGGERRERLYAVVANEFEHLRVLIADEQRERRGLLAQVVVRLGHEVIAGEIDLRAVAALTAREEPDVALVELSFSLQRALSLIEQIVKMSSCPVIALLSAENHAHVREAAKRGVFAYLVDASPEQLQSVIGVTLLRFADLHNLQEAFARRALIEQAKGILMGRNDVDAKRAFRMLRDHSRHNGQKLLDVAAAVVDSHLLLPHPHTD
jgi:response regulator NasT